MVGSCQEWNGVECGGRDGDPRKGRLTKYNKIYCGNEFVTESP